MTLLTWLSVLRIFSPTLTREDCYFNDKLVELFAENVEEIVKDAELGLTDIDITLKEINLLKEEYELEDEEADSTEVV